MPGRVTKIAKINLGASTLEIWSDIKILKKQMRGFSRKGIARANMRALNRTAAKTKTQTGRLLSKEYNIKVGDLRPFLKVSPKATLTKETVAIMGRSHALGVFRYAKGKKRQGPLGVRFNTGGGSKVHPHTFLARMPSGHHGVFVRTHKKGLKRVPDISRSTGKPIQVQLPIRELTYPSVAHMVTNVNRGERIFKEFVEDYPKQLFAQLDFENKKSKAIFN